MNLPPLPVPTLPMDAAHTWALAAYYKALEKDGPDIDKSKSALEMAILTYAEQYGRLCAEAERGRLQARVAELEANSERYLWLRDGNNTRGRVMSFDGYSLKAGDELDAAIDTARKAKP